LEETSPGMPEPASLQAVPPRQEPLSPIKDKILHKWVSRKEDKFWDVYLVFEDGVQLLFSRRDLCLMSDYFSRMFEGAFAESLEPQVPINGIKSSVMETMVESFYTRKVSAPAHVQACRLPCIHAKPAVAFEA
jgi:hypothetical protein